MSKTVSSSSATTAASTGSRVKVDAVAWFETERKISRATLAKMPVADGTVFFGELGRKERAIFFRYRNGWKARAYPDKAFTSEKGFHPEFWNLEAVLKASPECVYIVEGEVDACAVVEAGVAPSQVLACPSATPGASLDYVDEALKEGLSSVKEFVLIGDADEPGRELRQSLARILGRARCLFIDWPEGIKDANDYLKFEGSGALAELLRDGALPWPITGLFRASELPTPPPLRPWSVGFNGVWDRRIHIAPGTLTVVTGHPGHGKTRLFTQINCQIARDYGVTVAVASFETGIKPHLIRQLRTVYAGRREETFADDRDTLDRADAFIEEQYLFMSHPDGRPDLKWFLELAEVAAVRHGAKIITLDPWNRLETARRERESETDYIGTCLRELYQFAKDFNVNIQIVAHPAKTYDHRRSDPPELEDIAGSKHWDNMPDQGFVVHRPRLFDDNGVRQTYAELHYKKSRYEELGYATKVGIDLDIGMDRYGACDLRKKVAPQPKPQTPAQPSAAPEGDNVVQFPGGEQ